MKMIGTANLDQVSDAMLLSCIAAAALDLYEAIAVFRDGPMVDFALETLDTLRAERDRRAGKTTTQKVGFLG